MRLKPTIDRQFALDLSGYITQYAKKFHTDSTVSVAIAMQESSLENKNRMGYILKGGKLVYGVTDVGVFQLHVRTLANLKADGNDLDVERLDWDVEYQTYWHTRILSDKIRTCRHQRSKLKVAAGDEWSCYHSFTHDERKTYVEDVRHHLVKLTAR